METNKETVTELLREFQKCFNSMFLYRELGDADMVEVISNRVLEIKNEVLTFIEN